MSERRPTSRAELAREFDRAFAEPRAVVTAADRGEDVLALRAGGDAYLVRAREIRGLFADRKIVPAPSPEPSFLGLAGLRGEIVPVFSLAGLLRGVTAREVPRWMLLVDAEGPLGLAIDHFEGYHRLAPADAPAPESDSASVRIGESWRGVIRIAAVVARLNQRRAQPEIKSDKER